MLSDFIFGVKYEKYLCLFQIFSIDELRLEESRNSVHLNVAEVTVIVG